LGYGTNCWTSEQPRAFERVFISVFQLPQEGRLANSKRAGQADGAPFNLAVPQGLNVVFN